MRCLTLMSKIVAFSPTVDLLQVQTIPNKGAATGERINCSPKPNNESQISSLSELSYSLSEQSPQRIFKRITS
jgi:hypothetical protein